MKITTRTLFQRPALLFAAPLVLALAAGLALPVAAAPLGGFGAGAGPMMGHPAHADRLLERIGASAEQRTQIRQIMQAAQTDMKAQREAGRALHEQTRQLFTQPTVDARAAETLRQQMLAQHDQASKRMMQAMLDVSRVLTPEQRQQIAERMGQRRSMMERHRGERESLDKAPR